MPAFLVPMYRAAGTRYGIPWEILAAINEIETDYGRNRATSSAGAKGWMQFMPATWRAYGLDASGDGVADSHNPVDAIFAAARYLQASGAHQEMRRALFAYNHAWWYVDSVVLRAHRIAELPGKDELQRRVLADPRLDIYPCGRRDIRAGRIDRRVLDALEHLTAGGLRLSISSLDCGHSRHTSGGSISHHSSGNAVDIASVNGVPIAGHQGPGSITDHTIRRLLELQGSARPAQIISLMRYAGAANTLALPDHHDHIHVSFTPDAGAPMASVSSGARDRTVADDRRGRIANSKMSSGQRPTAAPPLTPDPAGTAQYPTQRFLSEARMAVVHVLGLVAAIGDANRPAGVAN